MRHMFSPNSRVSMALEAAHNGQKLEPPKPMFPQSMALPAGPPSPLPSSMALPNSSPVFPASMALGGSPASLPTSMALPKSMALPATRSSRGSVRRGADDDFVRRDTSFDSPERARHSRRSSSVGRPSFSAADQPPADVLEEAKRWSAQLKQHRSSRDGMLKNLRTPSSSSPAEHVRMINETVDSIADSIKVLLANDSKAALLANDAKAYGQMTMQTGGSITPMTKPVMSGNYSMGTPPSHLSQVSNDPMDWYRRDTIVSGDSPSPRKVNGHGQLLPTSTTMPSSMALPKSMATGYASSPMLPKSMAMPMSTGKSPKDRLTELGELFKMGLVTDYEFEKKRAEILGGI